MGNIMNRTSFLTEIMPAGFGPNTNAAGSNSLRVYAGTANNKLKDVAYIKRTAREKVRLNGAPIKYFPIDVNASKNTSAMLDNALKDHTNLILGAPIPMMATWTPTEYVLDLSKWGVMMPTGTDQQLFIHVDELSEKLRRKPLIGDIIETVNDTVRYRISDVFYGNANLWENIFCMVTLTKATYDEYTSQLDQYDDPNGANYANTYSALNNVLNIATDGTAVLMNTSNNTILKDRTSTYAYNEPDKRSIDTVVDSIQRTLDNVTTTTSVTKQPIISPKGTNGLDIMTMKL